MKEISVGKITKAVKKLCLETNFNLREDLLFALEKALETEESKVGQNVLKVLIENAQIAKEERRPLCQDTGYVTVFLEVGQEVQITEGDLNYAVNEGVREAYQEGYLRKSMVKSALFDRKNTEDNTPATIYTRIKEGGSFKISLMVKGAGSDNASRLKMLKPTAEVDEIAKFVLDVVAKFSAYSCPPMVVGVGIGGSFDSVALLSKKALFKPLLPQNPKISRDQSPLSGNKIGKRTKSLGENLLKKINQLGIGPAGLGGRITALGVSVEISPTHMACLPIAVNLGCHALRTRAVKLD